MDNKYTITVACPQCRGSLYNAKFDNASMRGRQEVFFEQMLKCIICRRHWELDGKGGLQEWPDRSKIGMSGVRELNRITKNGREELCIFYK